MVTWIRSNTGTNFRSKNIFNDLKADGSVLFGLEKQNKRFKNSQNHLNKVINKYGDDTYVTTGHSLGGSISSQIAKSNPNIYSIGLIDLVDHCKVIEKDLKIL